MVSLNRIYTYKICLVFLEFRLLSKLSGQDKMTVQCCSLVIYQYIDVISLNFGGQIYLKYLWQIRPRDYIYGENTTLSVRCHSQINLVNNERNFVEVTGYCVVLSFFVLRNCNFFVLFK